MLLFLLMDLEINSKQNYLNFFHEICEYPIPPQVPFYLPGNNEIPTYEWPKDRKELLEIRNSKGNRCGEFFIDLYGHKFKVTAGVKRNFRTFELASPFKTFPYMYKGKMKPLNYLFFDPREELQLNQYSVPISRGAHSYNRLRRPFVSKEEIKLLATCVLKILKGKELPQNINQHLKTNIIEIAGILITSEYFRGQQALSLSFTEFYQLKYDPTPERLISMYSEPDCRLLYPKPYGSEAIMNARENILKESFEAMFDCYCKSEEIKPIYSQLSNTAQEQLKEEFNNHKLQQLLLIYGKIENQPVPPIHFKDKLIQKAADL